MLHVPLASKMCRSKACRCSARTHRYRSFGQAQCLMSIARLCRQRCCQPAMVSVLYPYASWLEHTMTCAKTFWAAAKVGSMAAAAQPFIICFVNMVMTEHKGRAVMMLNPTARPTAFRCLSRFTLCQSETARASPTILQLVDRCHKNSSRG